MNKKEKLELKIFATQIRIGIVESIYSAKAGHPGGSHSIQNMLAGIDLFFQKGTALQGYIVLSRTRDFFLLMT